MGNQRTSGLTKSGGVWHVDKWFRGVRLCESTGTDDVRQAEEYLAKRLTELREAKLYGLRDARTFRAAATKYLQDYHHKKRIKDDALHLKQLDPFIGSLELKQVATVAASITSSGARIGRTRRFARRSSMRSWFSSGSLGSETGGYRTICKM